MTMLPKTFCVMAGLLAAVTLSMLAAASPADALLYTFSGAGGLAGTFTLDETTPIVVTQEQLGTAGLHQSPLNHIEGTFGAFTFEGTPALTIFDVAFGCCTNAEDSWIIRAGAPTPLGTLSGPPVNGVTPTGLNLFMFQNSDATMAISFTPPHPSPNPVEFSYTLVFSDGSLTNGTLTTLVLVPEPSTLALLALGLVGVIAVLAVKRSSPHTGTATARWLGS
jgi:PEP-CTERM motif